MKTLDIVLGEAGGEGPPSKPKGKEKGMGFDMGAARTDAAGALVEALGLDKGKLDLDAVASAVEDLMACCGGEPDADDAGETGEEE